jgi:bifunctional non-homologous end joining protein LigD
MGSKASAADLQKKLKPLIRNTQPYANRIAHKGIWVEPKLLAEIEYRAKERSVTRSSRACGSNGCLRSVQAVGGDAARQPAYHPCETPLGCDGARS